jgi:hypothetical protein
MKFILFSAWLLSSLAFADEAIDCRHLTASRGIAEINGQIYYGVFTFGGPLNGSGQWGMCPLPQTGNVNDIPMYRYHSRMVSGRRIRYVDLFHCTGGFVRQNVDSASSVSCL